MKVSLNWIRDYVQLPADADLKKLAYDLTMSTVEVEDATDLGASFHDMVVGVINTIEQHPNADKLKVCKTDIGGRVEDIVCGGSNLREGMKVAVALPGAMCKWHGEGDLVEIKKSKLRGVDSYGMICGAVEIGLADLFPTKEEAHILDLSDFDAPAGTPLADALDLNDIILEIDNKSMTNRPDLWGHYGIAREIAALHDLPMDEFFTYLKRYYLALSKQIQEDQETETLNEQRRILEYIRQHYMDSTLCLASVADVFGIHERSLQALLRNETQLSFAAYLEKIRLEQSMTLLTGTHLSIAEIALQVGYSNDRSFRRAFKRHYDKTPTELRQPPEGEKPDDPD